MMVDIYESNESLTIEEYLLRIPDALQRERTKAILYNSLKVLSSLNNSFGKNKDLPEIRIITSATANAEAISYVIRINSGLIDHCLSTAHADIETIFGRPLPYSLNSDKIATVSLSWILAHEWTHILRCHDDVIKELGSDPNTLQALEHDADYCAIAAAYRRLQLQHSFELSDLEIRELLLYCLFWTVRTLTSMSNTHEGIGQRLQNFIIKITTLSEQPGGAPDNELKTPKSHEIAKALINLFAKCEKHFQAVNTSEQFKSNLLKEALDRFSDKSYLNTTLGWEKISSVVERLSQTRATNK
ncbi:hypothetical protein [Pseudomonas sp. DP16D-R1]|uniref:hypothetical protein n=1 Tax=Pseudomonas sp. DP16D-R1 TaxID=2075551 RepID=UPI000CD1E468|nr:hypothetical protein [Pseudomonas sp. DP16D-R1]POA78853.1 hypothetical protein C1890_08550 [Pseudomonas sp. DP16D-R1]